MPSEQTPSQSQTRPSLSRGHRSTSSMTSGNDSPATSPNHHGGKAKAHKHVVHGARTHTRGPSLHKLTKAHGSEGSHLDVKLAKNASTTSLKKNSSHVSLKKNRSFADVRPKSSHGPPKRPVSVHFEIGDQDEGWEETSSSASPALSRSASKSAVATGHSSSKHSAENPQAQSASTSPVQKHQDSSTNGSYEKTPSRQSANAITEKLLQRTQSHNTTKMSLATATPIGHSPPSPEKSQISTANGSPGTGDNGEIVSRFVGGSGTPKDSTLYLRHTSPSKPNNNSSNNDEVKRAHSMGNLTRPRTSSSSSSEEESALAPRSRKPSSTHSSYVPPQQSRTQQKLWLQRASSNIEPAQLAPGGGSLVGAGYDGRDPRIKAQLERTGLEYLVVRRYQDPVGQALKRLAQLPGAEKYRRIPSRDGKANGISTANGNHGHARELSQSVRSQKKENQSHNHSVSRNNHAPPNHRHMTSTGSAGTGNGSGKEDEAGMSGVREVVDGNEDGIGAILRSMWEKSFDLSASAE